ncbi:hypothetical protein DMENIID0001_085040 [Sergentomyia squamirostris]
MQNNDAESECSISVSEAEPTHQEDVPQNPMVLVPGDPAEWTGKHIESWLEWTTREFEIDPPPQPARFPTVGQELVTLTRADFWVCAGSKRGGNLLAKHIAHLIHSATGRSQSPLLCDEDPGRAPWGCQQTIALAFAPGSSVPNKLITVRKNLLSLSIQII